MNKHSNSLFVYVINGLIVMACLASIIYTAMIPGIDQSVIAVVSGAAGTISGAIISVMLKSTGTEEYKNPSHEIAMQLLKNMGENVIVNKEQVQMTRGNHVTTISQDSLDSDESFDSDECEYEEYECHCGREVCVCE